jgi:hypothetical protein
VHAHKESDILGEEGVEEAVASNLPHGRVRPKTCPIPIAYRGRYIPYRQGANVICLTSYSPVWRNLLRKHGLKDFPSLLSLSSIWPYLAFHKQRQIGTCQGFLETIRGLGVGGTRPKTTAATALKCCRKGQPLNGAPNTTKEEA